jgi:hypothetical protein
MVGDPVNPAAFPVHDAELPVQLPVTLPVNAPVNVVAYTLFHTFPAVPNVYVLVVADTWFPDVMPFTPNASAPLDVIAPQLIAFAPSPSVPLDVIAPQPSVPIPDTAVPDSVIPLRLVTLDTVGDVTVDA